MASYEGYRGGVIPVGQRNPCIGRYSDCRGDPRHNLKIYTSLNQFQGLLSASSKNKRISPLQPYYKMSFPGPVNDQ